MVDLESNVRETRAGRLYRPRSMAVQIPLFIATFAGGPALGWMAGGLMPGLSENLRALLCLPYIAVFVLGYGLWLARLNAIAVHGIGKGLFKALFMLIVLRKTPQRIEDVMPSAELLERMAVKAQRAAGSFLTVALPVAALAGFVGLFLETGTGLATREIVIVGGCIGWGWVMSWLGRHGFLPLPEGE